eukprot:TRINITY_DN5919_c0_g1_i2.p1 TRINITY_DN5919_c0_g1~~TRINITY_DN5919_c0_g1_i2.p1  ORF type:complete len:1134 (+),score=376.14 TRINITY_DN5919_c0_g1_i2:46-3447(+)
MSAERKKTPLMSAASKGDTEKIVHILALVPDADGPGGINWQDHKGRTALHYATQTGQNDSVKTLLECPGCNPNVGAMNGLTPLMVASIKGNIDAIMDLTEHPNIEVNKQCSLGNTALHYSIEGRSVDCLELLLGTEDEKHSVRADQEICNRDGDSPLLMAIRRSEETGEESFMEMIVSLLREKNPNSFDSKLYEAATRMSQKDMADLILSHFPKENRKKKGEKREEKREERRERQENPVKRTFDLMSMTAPNGDTLLHQACAKGDREKTFRKIIEDIGIPVDVKNKMGQTPLHFAAKDDQVKSIKFLLEYGANINSRDLKRRTGLHYAARFGNEKTLKFLLKKRAAIKNDDRKRNALHYAARYGKSDCVQILLDFAGKDIANAKDQAGRTAVHLACRHGGPSVLKSLLGRGAKIDGIDDFGKSPIHYAAASGHAQLVSALLSVHTKNSVTNLKDSEGRTPLFTAALHGQANTLNTILQYTPDLEIKDKDGRSALHATMWFKDAEKMKQHLSIAQELVRLGSKINLKDNNGCTPLYFFAASLVNTCSQPSFSTTKINALLGKLQDHDANFESVDADNNSFLHLLLCKPESNSTEEWRSSIVKSILVMFPNAVSWSNRFKRTPIHESAVENHLASLEVLLSSSSSRINERDSKGRSALHLAAYFGNEKALKILSNSKGCKLDLLDNAGETSLHYASYSGSLECVKALISKGANLNLKDKNGSSALHIACGHGQVEIVKELISKGINVNEKNEKKRTPLMLCCCSKGDEQSLISIAKLLLKSGAQIEAKDKKKGHALMYAVVAGHEELVKELSKTKGCPIDSITSSKKSVADLAKENNRTGILAFLNSILPTMKKESNTSKLISSPSKSKTKQKSPVVKVEEEAKEEFDDLVVHKNVENEIPIQHRHVPKEPEPQILVVHSSPQLSRHRSILKKKEEPIKALVHDTVSPVKTEIQNSNLTEALKLVIGELGDPKKRELAPWVFEPYVAHQVAERISSKGPDAVDLIMTRKIHLESQIYGSKMGHRIALADPNKIDSTQTQLEERALGLLDELREEAEEWRQDAIAAKEIILDKLEKSRSSLSKVKNQLQIQKAHTDRRKISLSHKLSGRPDGWLLANLVLNMVVMVFIVSVVPVWQ